MKLVDPHSSADPDAAARKLVEIANDLEAVPDDRIFIERVNEPFLAAGGSGEQLRAGGRARHCTWLVMEARERDLRAVHLRYLRDPRLVTARAHRQRFRSETLKCEHNPQAPLF